MRRTIAGPDGGLVLSGFLLCLLSLSAHARTWYVNAAASQAPFDGSSFAHGLKTVQAAVDAATAKDTIAVAQGTYVQNLTISKPLSLDGGYAGTDTTTRDPAAYPTVLDGGGTGPVITLSSTDDSIFIEGFTIQNGTGASINGKRLGGGIVVNGPGCFVDRCIFKNNHVSSGGYGGAIAAIPLSGVANSQLRVSNCTFSNNSAHFGGAVAVLANTFAVYLQDSAFDHNGQASATSPEGLLGGAVYIESVRHQGITSNNTFTNNTANYGGAVYLNQSNNQTLSGNTFRANAADPIGSGGALYIQTSDPVLITANLFADNRAQSYGGALYSDTAGATSVSINSNVLVGNYAGAVTFTGISGGGMVVSSAYVVNNTIVGQQHGAGISIASPSYTANNIVAFNPGGITRDSGVVAGPLHNNNVFGNTNFDYGNINDPTGSDGNIKQDPLFVNRAAGDFHLLGASPCINAGNTSDAASFGTTKDFDGQARVNGPNVDIGADEFFPTLVFATQPGNGRPGQPLSPQPVVAIQDRGGNVLTAINGPVTVTLNGLSSATLSGTATIDAVSGVASFTDLAVDKAYRFYSLTATTATFASESVTSLPFSVLYPRAFVRPTGSNVADGGSWQTAKQTIPAALAVTGGPSGEVWVARGTYDGPISIPDDIFVYGGFEGTEERLDQRSPTARSTITGNNTGPCVRFVDSTGSGIDRFRLMNGAGQFVSQVLGGLPAHREGGAIQVDGGNVRISNCLILQNTATIGGGIAVLRGRATITNNVIAQNGVSAVAGLAGSGGAIFMGSGVVANNVIYENIAAGGSGSTTSFGGAMAIAGSPEVRNNTFVGNRSPAGQADIYISGSPKFTNNIIKNLAAIGKEGRSNPTFSHNDYVAGAAVANQITSPVGTNGNIDTVPVFVNAGSDNYHIPSESFLRDAGDISVVTRGEKDMDGEPRVMGAGVDIGADEVAVAFTTPDIHQVLAIWGGLLSASLADALRLDMADPIGIDVLDAAVLARKVAGLEPNP